MKFTHLSNIAAAAKTNLQKKFDDSSDSDETVKDPKKSKQIKAPNKAADSDTDSDESKPPTKAAAKTKVKLDISSDSSEEEKGKTGVKKNPTNGLTKVINKARADDSDDSSDSDKNTKQNKLATQKVRYFQGNTQIPL